MPGMLPGNSLSMSLMLLCVTRVAPARLVKPTLPAAQPGGACCQR
jgi:hypothetical protein